MVSVELANITKRFGARLALDSVTLSIQAGECLGIDGPSGSGKTTLLRLLAGLERPDAGRILFDGHEVSNSQRIVPPPVRHTGMMFQDLALWPHMTVEQHLAFVLHGCRLTAKERGSRVAGLLEACQLAPLRHARPATLSGGEAQRLALARALAPRPRLLLLDEPFSSLDKALSEHLATIIAEQRAALPMTLVIVSHDLDEVASLTGRRITLNHGRVL